MLEQLTKMPGSEHPSKVNKTVSDKFSKPSSSNNSYTMRNIENKYTFQELISRSLVAKANLTVEFVGLTNDRCYIMQVFDPLGNVWSTSNNPEVIGEAIMSRVEKLNLFTRVNTYPHPAIKRCLKKPF
jgi:hypothetical protein